jgi:hypothetical protein
MAQEIRLSQYGAMDDRKDSSQQTGETPIVKFTQIEKARRSHPKIERALAAALGGDPAATAGSNFRARSEKWKSGLAVAKKKNVRTLHLVTYVLYTWDLFQGIYFIYCPFLSIRTVQTKKAQKRCVRFGVIPTPVLWSSFIKTPNNMGR